MKSAGTQLLGSSEAILVCGSLNSNIHDRHLTREQVHPVQAIFDDGVRPAPFFHPRGRLGVSGLALIPGEEGHLYFVTQSELFRLDLEAGRAEAVRIPGLEDIHEMSVLGSDLWIANTGTDEAISYSLTDGTPGARHRCADLRPPGAKAKPEDAERTSFHLNQVFRGFDGLLYGLVHNVAGLSVVEKVAKHLLKKHGGGGVLCFDTGESHHLKLRAPHSVRKVGSEYWVFNSALSQAEVYDRSWSQEAIVPTAGWGRGAAYDEERDRLYVGISAPRRRYWSALNISAPQPNAVEIFAAGERRVLGKVVLEHTEQVNNVYRVPRSLAEKLCALPPQSE